MTSGVTIETRNLQKSFGQNKVLRGVNFSVEKSEFIAFVGRSGCGKSTLLRMIAGLDRPDYGQLIIEGRELTGINTHARVMFQDGRLLPWRRISENVGLGLPKSKQGRVTKLLEAVGLASRANDWPSTLSGGQKQRVALARALAAEPSLLLLDEPLGSLDALTRVDMQKLIELLWARSGASCILITHDIEEAVALADRVVLLADGQVFDEWQVALPRPRPRGDQRFTMLVHQIDRAVRRRSEAFRQNVSDLADIQCAETGPLSPVR